VPTDRPYAIASARLASSPRRQRKTLPLQDEDAFVIDGEVGIPAALRFQHVREGVREAGDVVGVGPVLDKRRR
jgi:hypothetical protein